MEKVLLVIDGVTPDRRVFQYAVELCKRIKAELNIFQIIAQKNTGRYLSKLKKKATHAKLYIEGAMAAAAFAEADEHDVSREIMDEVSKQIKELLLESEREGVACHFSVKFGKPEKEVIEYINRHRDVVLAIYDDSVQDAERSAPITRKSTLAEIKRHLAVPLVVVQDQERSIS